MLLNKKPTSIFIGIGSLFFVGFFFSFAVPATATPFHFYRTDFLADTTLPGRTDTLPYPIKDRRGDFLSGKKN